MGPHKKQDEISTAVSAPQELTLDDGHIAQNM
jgi:hypothetical protein